MDLDLDHLSFSLLFGGFAFGIIGFWMLKQGRHRGNLQIALIGVALMIYPYFIRQAWLCWFIGVALCTLAHRIW